MENQSDRGKKKEAVFMTHTERFILLKMKKDYQDIHFIRTLKYTRWDSAAFCWVISNNKGNLTMLRNYFGARLKEKDTEEVIRKGVSITPGVVAQSKSLLVVKYRKGRVRLIFRYEKELVKLIKTLPFYIWDQENRWWTIAHTEDSLAKLIKFCEERGWSYRYSEDLHHRDTMQEGKKSKDKENYREIPQSYLDKLSELRYSINTIKIYKACFSEFINYHKSKDLKDLSEKDIHNYLLYLVEDRQVSSSYQNQAINSIKFYYEKVIKGPRKVYYIERPRKEKTLPTVMSEDEVKKIFEVITNLKHKCLLMTC